MKALVACLLSIVLLGCAPKSNVESFTALRQATYELTSKEGQCSAVAIAPGIALSAAHCKGSEMVIGGSLPAQVLKIDEVADLMLLEVVGLECLCVPIAKGSPALDALIVVIGYPLNAGQVVTQGRVQEQARDGDEIGARAPHLRVITAPIIFGNSGGPVFAIENGKYVVVGIISMVSATGNMFFSVPIPHLGYMVNTETVRAFVRSLQR